MKRDGTLDAPAGHLDSIDVMRGAAAIFVAYLHGREVSWEGMRENLAGLHHVGSLSAGAMIDTLLALLTFPVAFGSIGVPIFFVLSGYCIHRGQARKIRQDPAFRLATPAFLTRRLVRIYPVLIGALLLTLALDTVSTQLVPDHYKLHELSTASFLINLFALQGIAGAPFGSNGALWTLALEIQFYLAYPLVLRLRQTIGLTRVSVLILGINAVSYALFERNQIIVFTSYYASWWLGAWLAERPLGNGNGSAASRYALAGAVLVATGCAVMMRIPVRGQYFAFQIWALGFTLAFPYLNTCFRNGTLAHGFRQIGAFSYSLYAIHLPVFVLLSCWFYGAAKPRSIVVSLLFLAVSIGVAWVFYLLIERPSIRWLASRPARVAAPGKAAS